MDQIFSSWLAQHTTEQDFAFDRNHLNLALCLNKRIHPQQSNCNPANLVLKVIMRLELWDEI